MSKDYSRNIELFCPTCGGNLFNSNEDMENEYIEVTCVNCGRKMSKDDLIQENQENINVNIEEIKEEFIKDLKKKFKWR